MGTKPVLSLRDDMSLTTPPEPASHEPGQPAPTPATGPGRRRWLKPLAVLATLALGWTVGVAMVLPGVLKPRIEAAGLEALGVPVSVDELALSPWTLTARLSGVQLGAAAQPMLRVRQMEAQVSLASLWHLAPVLRRVQIEQPEVWLTRLDARHFNISPVVDRLRARAEASPADDSGPARFAVFNISLRQGTVHYDDRVLQQTHLVDGIEVGVPFLSSLPSQIDIAVQPLLKARINGSALDVGGTSLPFRKDGHRSELSVRWRGVDVAAWLRHAQPLLPKPWAITPRAGGLSTDLRVVFEQTPGEEAPRLMVQGDLTVDQLDLGLPTVPGVVAAGQALGPVDLGWGAVRLKGLNLQPLVGRFSVAQVVLDNGHLAVQGRAGATVVWPRLQDLSATVRGLDNQPQAKPATWQVSLDDASGSHLQAQGAWHVAQAQGDARLQLSNGAVPAWWTAMASRLGLPVAPQAGRLGLQALVAVQTKPVLAVRLSEAQASLDDVDATLLPALPASRGDAVGWKSLTLDGVQATWSASDGASRWSVAQVALRDAHGRWHDTVPSTPAAWQWAQTNVTVGGLSHDFSQPLQVQLHTRAQGAGQIRFKGEVRPQPLRVQGQLALQSLDLRVLQSYLAPHLNVVLSSAQAQADGRLSVELRPPKAGQSVAQTVSARWRGQLGLDRLHLLDQVNDADVLRWRRLALAGSDLRWQGGELVADLGRITVQDFYGRAILQPDGRLNLAQLVRQEGEAGQPPTSLTTPQAPGEAGAAAPVPSAAAAPASSATVLATPSPGPDIRWRGIALSGGQVDFTDLYIKPNYSARLTQLGGTISAVAAHQPEPADVQLAGKVDDAAPLLIKGRLHPLGPRLYTDIEASAKGVELTRLTPYAARYAGYAIERGTLSVDVRYKVEDGRLEASNKLFLDQLTFGEPSGDPQATRLPVLLAVALLKNRQGEIDINLPISGSLDDPEFSVGGIVWRVIVNLITKAVTAPFSLLMGSDSNDAGQVHFAAGQSELDDAARKQLDALAAKLIDRPALKLDAVGLAHTDQDVNGLREAHVQRLMRQAKARALDEPLEEVRIAPEEADRWLAAAYRAADIKKPRNLVGVPKSLPPSEQRALLAASAPTDAAALKALANRRADVVKAYLIERLPAERVRLGASKLPEADGVSDGAKGLVGVTLALQ